MNTILKFSFLLFTVSLLSSCSDKNIQEIKEVLTKTDKVVTSVKNWRKEKKVTQFSDPGHIRAFTDLVLEKNILGNEKIVESSEEFIQYYSGDKLLFQASLVTIDGGTCIYFKRNNKVYMKPMTYRAENIMVGL